MSAHLCSHNDIHVIVDWARSIPPRDSLNLPLPPVELRRAAGVTWYDESVKHFDPRTFPNVLGRCLLAANWLSLQARYQSNTAEYFGNGSQVETYMARRHAFMYAATPGKAGDELGFILKQLDHFDYQASEVANYRATWCADVIDRLRREAVTRLPGYRAAPWGMAD